MNFAIMSDITRKPTTTKSDHRKLSWVKLSVSCFDDEKIRLIESMPDGDTLLVIWFKLLAQAGRSNASGYIILSETIPFTAEMMAKIFTRTEQQIRYALSTFEKMGMIEFKDECIFVRNFMKHHPEIIGKDQTKNRVAACRKRKHLRELGLNPESVIKPCENKTSFLHDDAQSWIVEFLKELQKTGKCPSLTYEGLKMVTRCFDETKLSKHWCEIVIEARDHSDHVLNSPVVWLRSAISRLETRLINLENKAVTGVSAANMGQLSDIPEKWRD